MCELLFEWRGHCSLIVPLTYRNPTPLALPQLIHASHGGWLDKDKELKPKILLQYRQENLTTFPNFPYYCENRKRWIYLGAPMVDPAEILTGSSYVVSEHGPILGSS